MGVSICDNQAEQKNPTIDYNSSLDEVMVCWDDRRNTDRDIYCGSVQLDSFAVNEIPVTARDLRSALDSVLANKEVDPDQKPSIGCNIKWHPGNEPSWVG